MLYSVAAVTACIGVELNLNLNLSRLQYQLFTRYSTMREKLCLNFYINSINENTAQKRGKKEFDHLRIYIQQRGGQYCAIVYRFNANHFHESNPVRVTMCYRCHSFLFNVLQMRSEQSEKTCPKENKKVIEKNK